MTLAMSGATAQDSGLASGLVNTTQQVGGALGLAVLASLSTTRTSTLLHGGDSLTSSLVSGYRLAFTLGAALVVAGIAVAAVLLRGGGRPNVEAVPDTGFAEPEPAYLEEAA
jgi:hypothetical protein